MDMDDIAKVAPYLVGGLGAAAGLWALVLLAQAPRRNRPDRGLAVRLAAVLGAIACIGFAVIVGMLGAAWGGSFGGGFVAGLAIGIGIGLATFVAGLAGYAALARPRVGSIAVTGVLLGPLLLGGALKLGVDWQQAARNAENRSNLAAIWQRNLEEIVQLSVQGASATVAADGSVERVHLTFVMQVNRESMFYAEPAPAVWLFAADNPDVRLEALLKVRTPYVFEPGEHVFTVDAVPPAGSTARPRPGPWTLRLVMQPGMPVTLSEETSFELRP